MCLWLSSLPLDAATAQRIARRMGTALVPTSQALLCPFPTSTAPSVTASDVSWPTSTATITPSRMPTSIVRPVVLIADRNVPRPAPTKPTSYPLDNRSAQDALGGADHPDREGIVYRLQKRIVRLEDFEPTH